MPPKCQYCGAYHEEMCSRIKSIEYHANGTIKLISLHDPPKPDASSISSRQAAAADAESVIDAYSRGVTAGKLEALQYTPEERERYGRWAAINWPAAASPKPAADAKGKQDV